jgi:alpha-1,3-mannosyl-glycoprotein beta-1,2-N-acetylglucosaminyltransferase
MGKDRKVPYVITKSKIIIIIISFIFGYLCLQLCFHNKTKSIEDVSEVDLLRKQLNELKSYVENYIHVNKEEDSTLDGVIGKIHSKISSYTNKIELLEKQIIDLKNGNQNEIIKDNNLRSRNIIPSEPTIISNSLIKLINSDNNNNNIHKLGLDTVLLIICSNRPEYLKITLDLINKYHPKNSIPIFLSEDGNSPLVKQVVMEAQKLFKDTGGKVPFVHMHHSKSITTRDGYYLLANHYKWALDEVFRTPLSNDVPLPNRVIILEEDLKIAPDFFDYFGGIKDLVDSDINLLGASAWNDNGLNRLIKNEKQLYRSDFFPGLGWMMTSNIWHELSVKWPKAYWDDWLREPKQRQGRHIIRPEICRTFHIGQHGVSNAQYSEFLNEIKLNDKSVNFNELDLSYLQLDKWNDSYLVDVYKAPLVKMNDFLPSRYKEIRIEYDSLDKPNGNSFVKLAKWAGCMDNIKANVPRTAYKGIVSIWKEGVKVHIAPKK